MLFIVLGYRTRFVLTNRPHKIFASHFVVILRGVLALTWVLTGTTNLKENAVRVTESHMSI